MSEQMTLWDTRNAISLPVSEDGATHFASQASPTTPTCGRVVAHASHFPRLENIEAQTMSATCGQSSPASSASAVLQSSLESRLQALLAGAGSPLYDLTWKTQAMPSGPPICALRARARRTSDSAFTGEVSGWPTPSASAFEARDLDRLQQRREECRARTGNGNGFGLTLGQAVPLLASGWTMPMANDATGSTHCYGKIRKDGTRSICLKLPGQAAGWATPIARDYKDGASAGAVDVNCSLGRQVWTPGKITDGSCAPTDERGRLHPSHAGWMMGYPREWDYCAATATPSSRRLRRRSSRPCSVNDDG